MANPEQPKYLQDSADDWNFYWREHAIRRPDLMEADLSAAQFPGADLSEANLAA
jgi:Pentapeptide repeats (8 copies)